jgi:ubiquinone/menaquinone biosynthesis C-methylase UbiE
MRNVRDHFSACASQYAAYRPRYPPALFEWLAGAAPGRGRAWDCACGNGQAAVDLARHFGHVTATDMSAEQIGQARPHPRIDYRVALAEASGLAPAQFDLVTVAQALHWFDVARFLAEARRVLRPGGLLAVWCYGQCTLDPRLGNAEFQHFYHAVVGPCWPPERALVDEGYATLPFPAPELSVPRFAMTQLWTLAELLGYVGSWSATATYRKAKLEDPLPRLEAALAPLWGGAGRRHPISWPLSVRAAKIS